MHTAMLRQVLQNVGRSEKPILSTRTSSYMVSQYFGRSVILLVRHCMSRTISVSVRYAASEEMAMNVSSYT